MLGFGDANSIVKSVFESQFGKFENNLVNKVQDGSLTAEQAQGIASGNSMYNLSPEQETYLNNMLANQRTNEARDYETQMANTDLLRAASQLGALGLSPSNVLSTGGSATPNVAAARVMDSDNANQRLQRATSIANSMIGLSSRLAGSGIYGSALKSVRAAGAKAASFSAHSAMRYFR